MLLSIDCWTAFLLGLVGSLHCAGMCGPLALALPTAGNSTPLTKQTEMVGLNRSYLAPDSNCAE